jgi:thiol-disulfide isomerase/thioredoxin
MMRVIQGISVVWLTFSVAAAAGVYSFFTTARDGERRRLCTPACALRPNYANSNKLAPNFELPTLDGGKRKLSDYRGKVVILNFWTKTCRPCLEEMPSLAQFARALEADSDIAVLTVTTDEGVEDARDTLVAVLASEPSLVTFIDSENEVVAEKYGTKLYPETWFIDKAGIIRARFDGRRDWMKPLNLEFARSLVGPVTCPIEFEHQNPDGPLAELCSDVPLAI